MSSSDHAHDEMWRSPTPAATAREEADDQPEGPPRGRVVEEHAVEDSWYQVLRRKHLEDAPEE